MALDPPALTFALQALLNRHESYMADAERDRLELVAQIERLQNDKLELEASNERTQQENKNLMDQIELLHVSVQDADTRIQQLEANLLSSQQTVRRLESATARAADMERQISVLEYEQDTLRGTLSKTEVENRDTMQRWRRAERSIVLLQEQIDRMEQEAKEERERHAEILGRMERQREVERELSTAAGRLKGAAAAKTLSTGDGSGDGKSGNSVISHFVRDLLSDNANLQLGMTELRELLMNSHDEIQALREQLMSHQPLTNQAQSDGSDTRLLSPQSDQMPLRQVHVHHHYHVAPTKRTAAKGKKKRDSLVPGQFNLGQGTLASPMHSPRPSLTLSDANVPNGLVSPIQDAHIIRHKKRDSASSNWLPSKRDSINTAISSRRDSIFSDRPSEYAASSVPSSPVSSRRMSLLSTCGGDDGECMTPSARRHRKHASEISVQGAIHAIAEEEDRGGSGSRPSQLTLRRLGTASAVVSDVVVQSTLSFQPTSDIRSSLAIASLSAATRHNAAGDATSVYSTSPSSASADGKEKGRKWTKWMPWSGSSSSSSSSPATTVPSSANSDSEISEGADRAAAAATAKPAKDSLRDTLQVPAFRNPGVNQPGVIPGYWQSVKARSLAARAMTEGQ
ncbi:hypothetical protein TD95_003831 [Thielaviopsis punctulata]|uniref:Uncharacterized protein n=1 Tax=Thielaviopsis punctulata TaxID=72032 RepID=A0A0F4ZJE5_9PEZI|nr:hypothetical protein TD95_003831 [Thielaviopsis punctulata]